MSETRLEREENWRTAGVIDTRHGHHFRLQSVPIRAVKMGEGFWQPRMALNANQSMPTFLRAMEERGVVDNFRRLSGRKQVEFRAGSFGSESDLYKWLEGACFVLQSQDLPELDQTVGDVIDDIAAAQGEDGYLYLNTLGIYQGDERFEDLERSHELYCAGHLMQAAVARYRATGQDALLRVACRFADYLVQEFGPGKRTTTDGHPEIEMGLIELYRTTGEQRYLHLAGFFLGQPQSFGALPPIAQRPALVGHAVRSGYICCGGADYYAETGDEQMLRRLLHLWKDLVNGKIYITGGVGSRYAGEAFGEPYELPSARAYAETCAAIAHAMWAWRMLLLTGEAQYADVMETILYNGFLVGVSLDGTKYFYMNPLACDSGYQRQPWFGCNCCPPNIHRTLGALPGYMFSTSAEGIWVHLYDACEAEFSISDGLGVGLEISTRYPWEGTIQITVRPQQPAEFTVFLRIPGWAEEPSASLNGEPVAKAVEPASYLAIKRQWKSGDIVYLKLPMSVQFMESHPRVAENRGCMALQRGPLVYCFESLDNPHVVVPDLALDVTDKFEAEWQPDLLGGVTVIRGQGLTTDPEQEHGPLYRPLGTGPAMRRHQVQVTAIPYYAWANRGDSAMHVWVTAVTA